LIVQQFNVINTENYELLSSYINLEFQPGFFLEIQKNRPDIENQAGIRNKYPQNATRSTSLRKRFIR